jgi:protein required for attachment to host cells
MKIWILCPNLRGARLFSVSDSNHEVVFLRELTRPRRQLREEDFPSDEDVPEATRDPSLYRAEIEVAEEFTRHVSRFLDESLRDGQFERIILCAEPQLLGMLRRSLSIEVEERVLGTVGIDLYSVNETDLASYVKDFLRERAA